MESSKSNILKEGGNPKPPIDDTQKAISLNSLTNFSEIAFLICKNNSAIDMLLLFQKMSFDL